MSTQLTLHRGARLVEPLELDSIEAPPPTDTWFPLRHGTVLSRVRQTLADAGYLIERQQLALSADNHRFFATLDLRAEIMQGISLAVGIRNSTDKSLPIGLAAGERVFNCDNLSFSSSVVIARRHTRHGELRFGNAITQAITGLSEYKALAQARIEQLQGYSLTEEGANSFLLLSAEKNVIGWRLLPQVIEEWRQPKHEEFRPRTAWSMLNAFTEALKDRQRSQPARACAETIQLQQLLLQKQGAIDVEFRPVEQKEQFQTGME